MPNPVPEEDFDPPAIKDAAKEPNPVARDRILRRARCGRYALSFFESVEAAKRLYRTLENRQDAASRYGDHIGEIDLETTDGLMSEPSKTGHINLHQEAGAVFAHRILTYYEASDGHEGAE